ncbi:MAG TPA: carboxypeptidase regulatory-like domain-containing protein [Candidatus Elarobacter sp.]|nr:carboxypeptidase regulatory-like domain-containing protein [Candidatus Elarobacter sp.]
MKAVVLLAALALASCSGGSTLSTVPTGSDSSLKTPYDVLGGTPMLTSKLKVSLFDAPVSGIPGIAVNMGIDAVQVVKPDGSAVPFVTNAKPDVVNLLDLQDHSEDFSGSAPAGTYSAVRVLIDPKTTNVTIGKFTIPILWGTAAQPLTSSVIAVDFPCTFVLTGLPGGTVPHVTLDFNVLRSVKYANGAIYVQPSVSAASSAAQVQGHVRNAAGKNVANASVLAVDVLGNVVNNTVTASDGTFWLHALPPGIYTIQVRNSYVTPLGETITASGNDAGAAPTVPAVLGPNDNVNLNDITD